MSAPKIAFVICGKSPQTMAGGLGAYGFIQLMKMTNVRDSISTKLMNPRIHKVNLSGITFRTEVAINNPTKDSMTITKPVVTSMRGRLTVKKSK